MLPISQRWFIFDWAVHLRILVRRARVRDDTGRSLYFEIDLERSFDNPLSGQSVYEQTGGVLRHTGSVRGDSPGTGLEAGAGAKVARTTRPSTRRHHCTVSLCARRPKSQGNQVQALRTVADARSNDPVRSQASSVNE